VLFPVFGAVELNAHLVEFESSIAGVRSAFIAVGILLFLEGEGPIEE
jgi:hypothetical protein